ncbi:aldose 1-epimerase family protein [Luteococcus peritonei]|uniref:Aldose 1-epimerase family protein n=1 Tax=Luteococcus peritonei TaxID=88874 RepID=A0ABW4RRQ1_9ACTN
MALSPTGIQHVLVHDDQLAIVTELGATLRSYRSAGHDVVTPFAQEASPFSSQGQQLAPWPNRIQDGHWVFDGEDHQLPLSEPERRNAIHGLVRWLPWQTLAKTEDTVTQRVLLAPQPGWPVPLEMVITHRLADEGLVVEVGARNLGERPVPYGYAAHPYLTSPDAGVAVDDCSLVLPFDAWLESDERLLPLALHPVEDSALDLRSAAPLGGRELDTAFTHPSSAGGWQAELRGTEHRTLLWAGAGMDWVQVYTPGDRESVAVEPMSIGPDAFNPGPTHHDLTVLAPGAEHRCRWGLRREALTRG